MSISRLTLTQVNEIKSAKDLDDLKKILIVNWDSLTRELRDKCVADTSIVPSQVSGASTASAYTVATSNDIDQTIVLSMMLRI